MKHTPGLWKANPLRNPTNPEYYCIYVKPGNYKTIQHICQVTGDGLHNAEEKHANARLIMAAPILLKTVINLHAESQHYLSTNVGGKFLQDILDKVQPLIKSIHGCKPT